MNRTNEEKEYVVVLAGSGNNGADALVALRILIMKGFTDARHSAVVIRKKDDGIDTPRGAALASLKALGVLFILWESEKNEACRTEIQRADIVIDGISGTGIRGPLSGVPREMAELLNRIRGGSKSPVVFSIDVPSGARDDVGDSGMGEIVQADYTLAIEPRKRCLYTPAFRPYCGNIIPVEGIFPAPLVENYSADDFAANCAELFSWEEASALVPRIPPDAYKYSRGVVEIRAGDTGTAGAALIAAKGAQSAGAGLVRLVVDDGLYPLFASSAGGAMVAPSSQADADNRFKPDAILAGPGWGRDAEKRFPVLEKILDAEKNGTPAVFDADALHLIKAFFEKRGEPIRFNGSAILTPHAGELAAFTGTPKEKLLAEPELVAGFAAQYGAVIALKSHVTIIAAPGHPAASIDGMLPVLGAGGTGDLLAGFCAAIAARLKAANETDIAYRAAVAAASLLAETGRRAKAFSDPLELAGIAAAVAGGVWL